MKTHFQTQIFKVKEYLNKTGVINEIRAHNNFGVQFGDLPEIIRNITDFDTNLTIQEVYGEKINVYTKIEFDKDIYSVPDVILF